MGTPGSGVGAVQAMWRYPIKSMMGEEVRETEISERGMAGDRAYALVDKASNRAAAVRTWGSRLMSYRAEYLEEPQAERPAPQVRIRTPDGEELSTAQSDIEARLSEGFDRSLSLMAQAPEGLLVECPPGTFGGKFAELTEGPLAGQSPAGTFFDSAPVHLIAASTIEHLQAAYSPGAVDARRFRANIVVEGVGEAFAENAWVGRRLGVGKELCAAGQDGLSAMCECYDPPERPRARADPAEVDRAGKSARLRGPRQAALRGCLRHGRQTGTHSDRRRHPVARLGAWTSTPESRLWTSALGRFRS